MSPVTVEGEVGREGAYSIQVPERVQLRRDAAMDTEKPLVHERRNRECLEGLDARVVHLYRVLV